LTVVPIQFVAARRNTTAAATSKITISMAMPH
jgi:hypothetical protein